MSDINRLNNEESQNSAESKSGLQKNRQKMIGDVLQQKTHESQETIELSEKELKISIDLVRTIESISSLYDEFKCYDENIKKLRTFNINKRNEYFKEHNISTKLDFQKYILELCKKYLGDFNEFTIKKGIITKQEDIETALKSLNDYKEYLVQDDDSTISFNSIFTVLDLYKQRI